MTIRNARALVDDYPSLFVLLTLAERWSEPMHLTKRHRRGASYPQLAKLAHMVGLPKDRRIEWYEVAKAVPVSDAHAAFMIGELV